MNYKEAMAGALRKYFLGKARDYGLEMAFLYGSWAGGFPREDSDVDIAVFFSEENGSEDEYFHLINDISAALEKEIGREVNIIVIRSGFDKPMLYYNAIALGIPVYIRDKEKYLTMRNEAIHQMEDFSIFGPEWQLSIARKNLEAIKYG
jgi:predicted nucleotidyltransferase